MSPSPDGRRARELFAALDSRLDDDPACQRRVVVALEKAMATPKSSNRRTPAVVDPFEVYRHDAHRLRPTLEDLDIERLKDIVAHYGVDARRLALKWESRERLIELIEQVVQQRARKGEAFRGVSDASR